MSKKADIVDELRRYGAVSANWASLNEAKVRKLMRDAADEIVRLRLGVGSREMNRE